MTVIKQLDYLFNKKEKIKLFLIFIIIVVNSLLELLGVTIILPIIDLAMDTGDIYSNKYCKVISDLFGVSTKEDILLILIAFTIGIYIVKNIFVCFSYRIQFRFAADVKMNLSTKLLTSYLKQPYSFFLDANSSNLMRNVSTDVDQLYQLISNVFSVVSNGITALIIVVYLGISNLEMTLTITAILGVCLCIIVFGLQKTNRRNGKRCQTLNGQLIQHMKQSFEGIKEIKVMRTEENFINMYRNTYRELSNISVKNSLIATLPKYLIEVFAVGSILVYLGINIKFNPNYMSLIPQLAVFCVAAFKLLPSVNALYNSFNMIIYYKASIDVVFHDIKETENLKNTFDVVDKQTEELLFNEAIYLDNISFNYKEGNRLILNKASLQIDKGTSVAFVGPSGGGKTTTADIILSLLTPQKGNVKVDDVDISEHAIAWRKKIGYIPQFIYLTDDTIRRNVAFGAKDIDIKDDDVWKALEQAQLKEYVESLPQGLDTEVGERGVRISGGQRQRIGIARALYRNPEVLVFDEATSALDNETEKEVMKAVDGLQGTKTIIMIAHRLSTIEKCDHVYKIEDGKIIKQR